MNEALLRKIRESVIGDKLPITTAFGKKPLVYADYTASGRALSFIEDYIQSQVLPFYANAHTETSHTGAHTTKLRHQAREIIQDAVNGNSEDKVIFCGSGATAAINKLIDILNLRLPADLNQRYQLQELIPAHERPVVFIGPYEHHSNELPWRESIADIEAIPLDEQGKINTVVLEEKLLRYKHRPLKIGSFSAASNVTGIKSNVDVISRILHQYGALAFWDYAAAAPYVGIDMNPECSHGDASKDAVFISPHKFIGGPGTPGILVVKEKLLKNSVPSMPGGGTVMYVTPHDHRYVSHPIDREEGGTPPSVESIRAGLVFKLQQQVGTSYIEAREHKLVRQAIARWQQNDNISILGNLEADRLSIVSFRILHKGKDLHYGFIIALLNDLFGIQARGGCSCAGPYGHALLNIDLEHSRKLEREVRDGHSILRPGWARMNFNYFIDEPSFDYLLSAVELIADHGWKLLPYYHYSNDNGCWQYQAQALPAETDLKQFDPFAVNDKPTTEHGDDDLQRSFAAAKKILLDPSCLAVPLSYPIPLPESAEALRWYALPDVEQECSSASISAS
jgi:selenocysteine lyase/cysteine desulfurase